MPVNHSVHAISTLTSSSLSSLRALKTSSTSSFSRLRSFFTVRNPTATATTTTFAAAATVSILSLNTFLVYKTSAPKKQSLQKWLKKRNFSTIIAMSANQESISPSLQVPPGAEVATFGAGYVLFSHYYPVIIASIISD